MSEAPRNLNGRGVTYHYRELEPEESALWPSSLMRTSSK
jgi:hypothetical protein